MGDFNFIRSVEDRNLPGGNMNDILFFNEVISNVGLVELPIKGWAFTWSNMQENPLVQQLVWFFTSTSWTISYPHTMVTALSRYIWDHAPCMVSIETSVPKYTIFRFENYWIEMPNFHQVVCQYRNLPMDVTNPAVALSRELKNLRGLKRWSKRLSNLNTLITDCNLIMAQLEYLEELRPLFI